MICSMKTGRRWLFATALMVASPLLAQLPEDPIDSALNAALARDLSTADQLAAIETARADWDARLNQVYRSLISQLPETSAAQLRRSQRAWLAFRDAEHAALDALYADTEGSLFRPMHALDKVALLRHRVQELESWRSTWELRSQ